MAELCEDAAEVTVGEEWRVMMWTKTKTRANCASFDD
jgi:hypothetical protein